MMCSRASTPQRHRPPHQRLRLPPSKRQTGGVVLVAGLLAVFVQGGCSRPGPIPAVWTRARTGHVYTARLLSEHPLYPQYQRLEQEIAALRKPRALAATPSLFLPLGDWFLPAPDPPTFPLQAFGERERAWRLALLPDRPLVQTELDPDLAAEVAWARAQARQAADTQLAQVEAEQGNWLAEVRAQAVRARQEALNNAGLELSGPERDADAAADKERERLWAGLEEELKTSRKQAEAQVDAARRAITQKFETDAAAAAEDARRRMGNRAEMFVKSGSEMRSRMSKSMTPPEPLLPTPGVQWRPQVTAPAGNDSRVLTGGLNDRDRQVRLVQADLLAGKRAEIAAQMEEGTERAVRRLGGLRGAQVSFPPSEPTVGKDLTEDVRPALRAMFQQ